jgi:hypothetical protein
MKGQLTAGSAPAALESGEQPAEQAAPVTLDKDAQS